MKFTTKHLTLSQRIECNRIRTTAVPDDKGYLIVDVMWNRINYIREGLDTLNGVKITNDNFDEELNKLSDIELYEISDDIFNKANISKKKKSL